MKKTTAMTFKSAISWFEIPAVDIDRAQKFYESIFETQLMPMDMEQFKMRMFPLEDPMNGTGGAVVNAKDFYTPSSTAGVLIYLNGNPDVQIVLDRVEAAGGKIVLPKTNISDEHGYMAVFTDTEGNRVGLHSVPEKYLNQA